MPQSDRSVMVCDVRQGERLQLADVVIELLHKSGRVARLQITLPREVKVTLPRQPGDGAEAPAEILRTA